MRKSIWNKLLGSLLRLFFPAFLLIVLAIIAVAVWLVYEAATPPHTAYLVTPERLTQFTNTGKQFTDETWANGDGTRARGWLVRGASGAPAVIMLHRYGADRSWLLNLGVRLHGATNFTVLIPDLRGHGENPTVENTSFGGCEANDLAGAINFLQNIKNEDGSKTVGQKIGVYGVEMGAIAAMLGASGQTNIQALALDSVPASSSNVLQAIVNGQSSVAGNTIAPLAETAAPIFFYNVGCYKNTALCELAASLSNRKVLLLAGRDTPQWQQSTNKLAGCFGNSPNVQKKLDLQPSGYNLASAGTSDQQIAYSNIVIEFFQEALSK